MTLKLSVIQAPREVCATSDSGLQMAWKGTYARGQTVTDQVSSSGSA